MVDVTANPALAANAYGATAKIGTLSADDVRSANPHGGASFGNFLEDATRSAIGSLKAGEQASAGAVTGTMDPLAITQAVTAARLTLDTVSALRDAAVDAYNKIQGMPI